MNASILIVEDEASDALLIQRALKKACPDLDISIVADGPDALARIMPQDDGETMPDHPTCILLDLKLRQLDGLEVLKEIKSNDATRKVPVIIYSSSSDPSDVKSAYDIGANSYIIKPVDNDDLSIVAEKICDYWFSTNFSFKTFKIAG